MIVPTPLAVRCPVTFDSYSMLALEVMRQFELGNDLMSTVDRGDAPASCQKVIDQHLRVLGAKFKVAHFAPRRSPSCLAANVGSLATKENWVLSTRCCSPERRLVMRIHGFLDSVHCFGQRRHYCHPG